MKLKNAKNSGIQISDKDKNLIFVVGIVAVLFLGYNFLISPKLTDVKTDKEEYQVVKTKRDNMKEKFENIATLKKDKDDLLYTAARMKLRVPAYDSLPYSISMLFNFANKRGLVVTGLTSNDVKYMTAEEYLKDDAGKSFEEFKGNPYVVQNVFGIQLSGNYDQIYGFLKDAEEADRKYNIGTLKLEDVPVGGLEGTFSFETLSYIDKDNVEKCPYILDEIKGKFDAFTMDQALNGYEKDMAYYTPEYFMNINQSSYEGPKVAFMENGKFNTEVFSTSPKEIEGRLTIDGNEHNLTVNCVLDKSTKVINSKVSLKDNVIRMTVLSSARVTADDAVKLTLSVDNRTKFNLEITVVNDDISNPKFVLKESKPNVILKGVTR